MTRRSVPAMRCRAAAAAGLAVLLVTPGDQQPTEPPRDDATTHLWHGWLHELLDGDMARARASYERAVAVDTGRTESVHAAYRRYEIHRVRGEEEALESSYAELLRLTGRDRSRERAAERIPEPRIDLEAAAAEGPEALARERARFLELARENIRHHARWTLAWGPGRPPPRGSASGPADPALTRLSVPLPRPGTPMSLTRRRAVEICRALVQDRTEDAIRLEQDLVARLQRAAQTAALGQRAEPNAEDAPASVDAALRALDEALAAGMTTPDEARVLATTRDRIAGLRDRAGALAAARFAAALPYRLSAPKR